jgi:hypothetical protein
VRSMIPPATPVPLYSALRNMAAHPVVWDDARVTLSRLAEYEVYLGGDGLRPYVSFSDGGCCRVIGVEHAGLPAPPLVAAVRASEFGTPSRWQTGHREVYSFSVPDTVELAVRLSVPRVLLVGLGDADRYRGARLPLGIARLAQWLRYTHTAAVDVLDYSLTEAPEVRVADLLATRMYEVLGVSVNFGQWSMLERLAAVVNTLKAPPLVVLGNILAAFSPTRAAKPFDAASVLIATSLGERPLQQLLANLDEPGSWARIDGLIRPDATGAARPAVRPPDLVFPDDELVLAVAKRGGQISLETSFGCQYGKCTFCPREHRGDGWERGQAAATVAILDRLAGITRQPNSAAAPVSVSFVDEEFFGSEGLQDPPGRSESPARTILDACRRLGLRHELYTRLEQLYDARRSVRWNLARAELLATHAPQMRRVFVGVESGSRAQLRRYGKGQTIAQTVDALRVASTLRVPLEFGFITFDPLLTPPELAENIAFLGRRDVLAEPGPGPVADRV